MLLIFRLVLARSTRPTEPTPQATPAPTNQSVASGDEELERHSDLPIPRLSMPIDQGDDEDNDDDSFHGPPPRFSVPLDDDIYPQASVEMPRRAVGELPYGRFSRGSFGSVGMSDRFVDMDELGLDAVSDAGTENVIPRPEFDAEYDISLENAEAHDPGYTGTIPGACSHERLTQCRGETQDLRRAILEDPARRESRLSDIRPRRMLEGEEDTTFAFQIPYVVPRESSSPEPGIDIHAGTAADQSKSAVSPFATMQDQRRKGSGSKSRSAKARKVSRHGIAYPSLPPSVVTKLASTFARTSGMNKAKISKEALEAISQASDWFFEQLGDDLGTYAKHAGRQTIDETDVIALMKRYATQLPRIH